MKAAVLSMSTDGFLGLIGEYESLDGVAAYLREHVEDDVPDLKIQEVVVEEHRVKLLLTSESFPESKGWDGVSPWTPKWRGEKQEVKP